MIDHALGEQTGKGLFNIQIAALFQGAGEKPGIEQMQNRVLDPADILIDRQPVAGCPLFHRLIRMWRAEAGEIPGRIHKGVERVGFPLRRLAAGRAIHMLPAGVTVQRIAGRLEIHILRQLDRQIFFRHRNNPAICAVNNRDRASPIALTGHAPVA